MLRWAEFQRVRPDLAEAGRRLLYQFGVGLAFLATVRADGGPRLHPMCPLVTDDALLGDLQCDDEVVEGGVHEASEEVDVATATPTLGGLVSAVTPQHPRSQSESII
jgi:hypothetical protein